MLPQFSLCKELNLLNSLCFPCLEKLTAKFPVFPVPWPPCICLVFFCLGSSSEWTRRQRRDNFHSTCSSVFYMMKQSQSMPRCAWFQRTNQHVNNVKSTTKHSQPSSIFGMITLLENNKSASKNIFKTCSCSQLICATHVICAKCIMLVIWNKVYNGK